MQNKGIIDDRIRPSRVLVANCRIESSQLPGNNPIAVNSSTLPYFLPSQNFDQIQLIFL